MSAHDDDAKKAVLARRARFVAAAIASVGIACGKNDARPGPCLSAPPMPVEAGAPPPDAAPMPCLSQARPLTPEQEERQRLLRESLEQVLADGGPIDAAAPKPKP